MDKTNIPVPDHDFRCKPPGWVRPSVPPTPPLSRLSRKESLFALARQHFGKPVRIPSNKPTRVKILGEPVPLEPLPEKIIPKRKRGPARLQLGSAGIRKKPFKRPRKLKTKRKEILDEGCKPPTVLEDFRRKVWEDGGVGKVIDMICDLVLRCVLSFEASE